MSNLQIIEYFIILFALSLSISFFTAKYSKNLFFGLLNDKDFLKPQAFHKKPIPRAGGLVIFFSLLVLFILYNFFYKIFLLDYFIITLFLFFLGFVDDLRVKINPNIRLILMIIFLFFCINLFSIKITKSGLEFLNFWLENRIFQTCFVLLCFLFIINGSNFIDGFNGLLSIHFLIITILLFSINLSNHNFNFSIILLSQILIVFSFLIFNFPKAIFFLGDSGSYVLGSLAVLNTIKTYELNIDISPFFFASILYYLFFEVFFSFIRKSFQKKSPLQPDILHLHMLIYDFLKNNKSYKNINPLTSFIINSGYFFLIVPTLFFRNDGLLCRNYFIFLILSYILSYIYFLLKFKKK
jgi:UDP-N-acetylmuramyl pentapeptide phosphotransferase/UDP-N-acetylglucosamine-1-phosphate transferase